MKQVVVITGASSGIGLEIARNFVKLQKNVVCLDIKPGPPNENIHFLECDVSSESTVINAFKYIVDQFGPTQFLINNSGLQYMSPIEDFPLNKWQHLIDVILTGTFLCSREAIKHMKKERFGRIVNISSIHGKEASPYKAAYVAAKHGVLGLTKVMAKELAPFNITANAICPGFVDTPLMREQVTSQMKLNELSENEVLQSIFLKSQDIKKLTTPQQIADMVLFLTSSSAETITGEAFNVSGGWGMGH